MIYNMEPDNEEILQLKYYYDGLYLSYSIHEIPLGVFKDYMNDATLSDIPEMLGKVDVFQTICSKLGMLEKDKTLIEDCRKYYTTYAKYLQNQNQFIDFEDYMKVHQKMDEAYLNKKHFNQMSLVNISEAGRFAADRSIKEYADKIWYLKPVK